MEAPLIGWREGLILLAAGVAVYLFVTLVRLVRALKRKATDTSAATSSTTDFQKQLAERLAYADLEREIRQLRADVEKLRQELEELRAVRFVSPHYGEALALAQRGLNAQQIADRMGISLAEAELVLALSRGESAFAEGRLDEAIDSEQ